MKNKAQKTADDRIAARHAHEHRSGDAAFAAATEAAAAAAGAATPTPRDPAADFFLQRRPASPDSPTNDGTGEDVSEIALDLESTL